MMETIYFSNYAQRGFYSSSKTLHNEVESGVHGIHNHLLRYQRIFPHKSNCGLFLGDHEGVDAIVHDGLFLTCYSDGGRDEFFSQNCIYNKSSGVVDCKKMDCSGGAVDYIQIRNHCRGFFTLHEYESILKRDKPLVMLYDLDVGIGSLGFDALAYSEDYLRHFGYVLYGIDEEKGVRSYYCPNDSLAIGVHNLYCFWTGENAMSEQRQKAFEDLLFHSMVNVKLVTLKNVEWYILPAAPLHRAYAYLSETHKADYLRTYFMHFYGGGFSDIKRPGGSWIDAFYDMMNHEHMMVNGYKEVGPSGLAHSSLAFDWEKNIGNCAYICRPHSALTKLWYGNMMRFLDSVYEKLVTHPASCPQDCKERGGGYPIEWNQMLGRIFHICTYNYRNYLGQSVPVPDFQSYR